MWVDTGMGGRLAASDRERRSVIQTMKLWSTGDRVVHTGKPEWGSGAVSSATRTTQDGKPCQLLTIRFDRAGVKTISTAFANLIPAEDAGGLNFAPEPLGPAPTASNNGKGHAAPSKEDEFAARLMGGPGTTDIRAAMTKLPEPATDPFSTPIDRLKATLGLYRFAPTGGSLLDWAAMQSGLADPLSRFNRHELEKFFESFAMARDGQLRKAAGDARKADPVGAGALIKQALPSAQQALRRLDAMR
jgi:hypothetical protein